MDTTERRERDRPTPPNSSEFEEDRKEVLLDDAVGDKDGGTTKLVRCLRIGLGWGTSGSMRMLVGRAPLLPAAVAAGPSLPSLMLIVMLEPVAEAAKATEEEYNAWLPVACGVVGCVREGV